MTIFSVEMDRLAALAQKLHGLADEAGGMNTAKSSANPLTLAMAAQRGLLSGGSDVPTSVTEAMSISHDLVDTDLVPAVRERLRETGDLMVDVANQYRNADETKVSLTTAMTTYTNATGDWNVPAVPS